MLAPHKPTFTGVTPGMYPDRGPAIPIAICLRAGHVT
jgi:hypothetical protein